MAKVVRIIKKDGKVSVVVDNNEITDVVSYELSETTGAVAILTLSIAILDEIEVQR